MIWNDIKDIIPSKPKRVLLHGETHSTKKSVFEIGLLGGELSSPYVAYNGECGMLETTATHWADLSHVTLYYDTAYLIPGECVEVLVKAGNMYAIRYLGGSILETYIDEIKARSWSRLEGPSS